MGINLNQIIQFENILLIERLIWILLERFRGRDDKLLMLFIIIIDCPFLPAASNRHCRQLERRDAFDDRRECQSGRVGGGGRAGAEQKAGGSDDGCPGRHGERSAGCGAEICQESCAGRCGGERSEKRVVVVAGIETTQEESP